MYVYACVVAHMYGSVVWRLDVKAGRLSSDIIILFTETGTSTGQGIPGILLSLPPQCWDSKGVPQHPAFPHWSW